MRSNGINPASATNSQPRPSPARCRSGGTRRNASRMASMPNSFPAPPSPRRGTRTGAAGCIASVRRPCISRLRCWQNGSFHNRFDATPASPNQLRWDPLPMPAAPTDFVDGLMTMAGNGSAAAQTGVGIHVYAANQSMHGRFFYNADGEMLIVPQQGRLRIATELGVLEVEPQEIAVIPRGIRFRVELPDGEARGYVAENFGALLRLPELGPIGSNGLANARDFLDAGCGVRGYRRRFRTDREIPGSTVVCAHRSFAARCRRLARQLRAVQIRSAPLQHDRFDQLRSSRSVDLHRADVAERHARRRQSWIS